GARPDDAYVRVYLVHGRSAAEGTVGELLQETHVVLPVKPQVRHPIDELGDALHTHAEGKATVHGRIDAAVGQHGGIHHAAAHDLHPSAVLAHGAPPAPADGAAHVHLGA